MYSVSSLKAHGESCAHAMMTRPAVQAYRRASRRFHVPRPASILLEEQSRQAEVVGIQYVTSFCGVRWLTLTTVLRSIQAKQDHSVHWNRASSFLLCPDVQLISPFSQSHAMDLVASFGSGSDLKDYVIRFTSNLDPNGKNGLGIPWPQWNPQKPKAIIFQDGTLFPIVFGDDNYRTDAIDFVTKLSLLYPI
jgi:hypothetical protein